MSGPARRRPLAILAALVLVLAGAATLAACGDSKQTDTGGGANPSSSPSPLTTIATTTATPTATTSTTATATATTSASPSPLVSATTYTDPKLGFSITVGAPFTERKDDLAGALDLGETAAAWIDPDAPLYGGEKVNAIIVGTMDLGEPVTDTLAQSFIDELLRSTKSLKKELGKGATIDAAVATTIAGRPAASFEISLPGPQKTPMKARLVIVVGSDTAYIVFATSAAADWPRNGPVIETAISSFKLE